MRLLRYAASDEANIAATASGPYVEVIYTSLAASYELMKHSELPSADKRAVKKIVEEERGKTLIEQYRGQGLETLEQAYYGSKLYGLSYSVYLELMGHCPDAVSLDPALGGRISKRAWDNSHGGGLVEVINDIRDYLELIAPE